MRDNNEEYCEVWKRRLEENEKCLEQMRMIKHDMQAHFVMLQYYLETEMYEEAKAYLKMIRNTQMSVKIRSEIDTGNSLVNALIEDYISRDKEISFWCEGKLPEYIKMSDYELCIVFSNLLSNAVEACGRLKKTPKEIKMKLYVNENQFEMVIENSIEWDVDFQLLGSGTTKMDAKNHGYGIKNVKKVVRQKNGDVNFEIVKDKFRVHINIPMIEMR